MLQEYLLELVETYDPVLLVIMLLHYFVEVFLRDLVPYFVHGRDDVFLGDYPRAVGVELAKNGLQLVVVQEVLHVQGGDKELGVVYLFVAHVVDFVDDALNLVVWDVDAARLNRLLQLFSTYQAGSVLIYLDELRSQTVYLILISHLDQHIHRCFL